MDRSRWCCPWTDRGFTGVVGTMQLAKQGTIGSDMHVEVHASLPLGRRVALYFFDVHQTDGSLLSPSEDSAGSFLGLRNSAQALGQQHMPRWISMHWPVSA